MKLINNTEYKTNIYIKLIYGLYMVYISYILPIWYKYKTITCYFNPVDLNWNNCFI